ncbi:MAG: hypothetical protein EOP04_23200 [Proteobacteria bacterium]|nr:MAG: hypothetical protein EOP04_23200 [Pseudomonadota bacterium]
MTSIKADLDGVSSIGVSNAGLSLTGSEGLNINGFDEAGNILAKKLLSIDDAGPIKFEIRSTNTVNGALIADIRAFNPADYIEAAPEASIPDYTIDLDSGENSITDCRYLLRIKKDGTKSCFIREGMPFDFLIQPRDYFPMPDGYIVVLLVSGNPEYQSTANFYEVSPEGVATQITFYKKNEVIATASQFKSTGAFFGFEVSSSSGDSRNNYAWKHGMAAPALVGSRAAVGVAETYFLSANGFTDLEGKGVDFTNLTSGYESIDAKYVGDTMSTAVELVENELKVISRNGLVSKFSLTAKTMTVNYDIEGSGALNNCEKKSFLYVNHVGYAVDPCLKKIYRFNSAPALTLAGEETLELQELPSVSDINFTEVKSINGKIAFFGTDIDGSSVVGTLDPASGETIKNKVDSSITSLLPL